MKKLLMLVTSSIAYTSYLGCVVSFSNELWHDARAQYQQLEMVKKEMETRSSDSSLLTSYYEEFELRVRDIILNKTFDDFINDPMVRNTMVRIGYDHIRHHEEEFLEQCISKATQLKIAQSKDIDLFPQSSSKFNCSANTLGHLYYVGRVVEALNKRTPSTIVELGGGFGNLARIFKEIYPDTTYVIIDLAEMLTIDYFFLKSTLPHTTVKIHTTLEELQPGSVNLIPVFLLNEFSLDQSDVFVSSFALTEAPQYIHTQCIKKNFFNAQLVYITGQLNGWKEASFQWMDSHHELLEGIRSQYSFFSCNPFHIYSDHMRNFELIAQR